MASWQNDKTATLKVRSANSGTESFNFVGVAAANSAGTPEQFLSAVNNILDISGKAAVLTGMTRTIKQEVN